ncbi:PBECR3 domain-containing polyvalent protein [Amedibacillus sp. YH-ame10]
MSIKKIASLDKKVIDLLSLDATPNSPILIGEDNIKHMLTKHPIDYDKYKNHIADIIVTPDYIRLNTKDNSIEYVKEFQINDDYVKVAVRTSRGSNWFVRSMYTLNKTRVTNYINKGTLIKF